jgi:uncharacterized membrane protein required for colicin V production
MTIWILAVVLVLSLMGLGYRQGAIRVAFSLVGIFMGILLAVPLAKPCAILLKAFGVQHPVVLWMVPPFIAFCLISAIFKSIALAVHHKIEVYFRYKTGDLRFSLWERLNRRLGLCLGVINGTAYTVLLAFVIYVIGYWSVQLESTEGMNFPARLVTRMAKDLQNTGFIKSARALDRLPASYYDAADAAGLVYQNSLLEARLARYPAFLMLAELPDFKTLGSDTTFAEMRARKDSVQQLLAYQSAQTIAKSPETLREIWTIAQPNLKDLYTYLQTGASPKYSEEPVLGRWNFDARGTAAAMRRANPNMTALQMSRARRQLGEVYGKAQVVAGTESRVIIKNWPDLSTPPAAGTPPPMLEGKGEWEGGGNFYKIKLTVGSTELSGSAAIEGERMTVTLDKLILAFEREY